MRFVFACALVSATAACSPPSPQPQPEEMETINATRVDEAAPAGVNYAEGNITPAERGSIYDVERRTPAEVVALYARLLDEGRFEAAYRLWDRDATALSQEEFVAQFDRLETIDAAVGRIGPLQAGGSALNNQVQLTLTGKTAGGENYSLTGPVMVRRAGNSPGATDDQRRWRIVKMQLTANPELADALIRG